MEWKSVAKTVASAGLKGIGTMLGGPTGASVGGMLANALGLDAGASPEETERALLSANPEQMAELKRIDAELEKARIAALVKHHEIDAGNITDVNVTMQAEAKTNHPWQGAWRPFWGFVSAIAFALAVLGFFAIIIYAIHKNNNVLLTNIPALVMAFTALFGIPGAILGVASWHRGQMQRIQAGETKKGVIESVGMLLGRGNKS